MIRNLLSIAENNMNIPYGRQEITAEDIQAVTETLKADFLTQGPKVAEFERAFAAYEGAPHAVAVANGTAALHLSAMALGVKPGDKVITTPITFAASANSILYCGGEVIFADIDAESLTLDVAKVRELLEADKDKEIKGIIPVDFAGYPCDIKAFRKLADEFGVWILEDACHAPGAEIHYPDGEVVKAGDGKYCDLAIFSFHPVKHIAAGEGGMVTTASEELADKVGVLRTHGITKDPEVLIENHGGWYYEMHELGYNYRLTDIHCALGLSQLKRADAGLAKRREIASVYDKELCDLPLGLPKVADGVLHGYHLYVIRTKRRKELYDHLRAAKIFAQIHYIPVHYLPYYRNLGWKKGDFPVAESYYDECLSLPMFPSMTKDEQAYVIDQVKKFFA